MILDRSQELPIKTRLCGDRWSQGRRLIDNGWRDGARTRLLDRRQNSWVGLESVRVVCAGWLR